MFSSPCRPTQFVPNKNRQLVIHIIVFHELVKNRGTVVMAAGMSNILCITLAPCKLTRTGGKYKETHMEHIVRHEQVDRN
jgi:hypothetical protein